MGVKSNATVEDVAGAAAVSNEPADEDVVDLGDVEAFDDNAAAELSAELGLSQEDLELESDDKAGEADEESDESVDEDVAEPSQEKKPEAEVDAELEGKDKHILDRMAKQRDEARAQAEEAERKLGDLQQRVEELEAKRNQGRESREAEAENEDPVERVRSFDELNALQKQQREIKRFAARHWDGVEGVDLGDGKSKDFSAEEIREAYANADEMLERLDERRGSLQQEQQVRAQQAKLTEQVKQEWPELYDSKSPEFKALGVLGKDALTAISKLAHGDLLLGLLVNGMRSHDVGKQLLAGGQKPAAGGQKSRDGGRAAEVPEQKVVNGPAVSDVVKARLEREGAKVPGAPGGDSRVPHKDVSSAKTQARVDEALTKSDGDEETLAALIAQEVSEEDDY